MFLKGCGIQVLGSNICRVQETTNLVGYNESLGLGLPDKMYSSCDVSISFVDLIICHHGYGTF